jgi:predicted nucleic acid-binding protein
MKLLLDTCILAELRDPQRNHLIKQALTPFRDEDLYLSVITIGEIAKGIALLPTSRKKNELLEWLTGLEQHYSERILPIGRDVAFMWGELTVRSKHEGTNISTCDGLLAATALFHGLHFMTRNIRHFQSTGALIIDPGNETPH